MHNSIFYKLIGGQWKIVMPEQVAEDLMWACHESERMRMRAHINANFAGGIYMEKYGSEKQIHFTNKLCMPKFKTS